MLITQKCFYRAGRGGYVLVGKQLVDVEDLADEADVEVDAGPHAQPLPLRIRQPFEQPTVPLVEPTEVVFGLPHEAHRPIPVLSERVDDPAEGLLLFLLHHDRSAVLRGYITSIALALHTRPVMVRLPLHVLSNETKRNDEM